MIQFRKWMISPLSAFLPVHPFGFKSNNNPTCVAQMCENNGQGEWNFLMLKISQRKGNGESNGCRYGMREDPAWYSCVIFRRGLGQPKDFNGTSAQEDILMHECEDWKFPPRWGGFIDSHLRLLVDLTLADFQQCDLLVFWNYLLIVELKYNLVQSWKETHRKPRSVSCLFPWIYLSGSQSMAAENWTTDKSFDREQNSMRN